MSRSLTLRFALGVVLVSIAVGCSGPNRPVQENLKRGWEAIEAQNVNAAIDYFNRAILLDHRNAEGYLGRAEAYRMGNEPELSAADFERALLLDPHNRRAHALRGMNAYSRGDYTLALQSFSQAIVDGSRDANTYYYRGETYRQLGREEEARDDYARALAAEPDPRLREQIEFRLAHDAPVDSD